MEKFIITEEMLMNARDYIPIDEKNTFLRGVSNHCFDLINIKSYGVVSLPPMHMESTVLKSFYMMGAFLKLYFGIDYELQSESDAWLMTNEQYDYFASSHPFNQLERMKSNPALRDKCFDLIQDYKDLEKKLNAEVYGLVHAMNDVVGRTSAYINQMISPELTQEMISMLTAMAEEAVKGEVAEGVIESA